MTSNRIGRLFRATGIVLALMLALGVAPIMPMAAFADTLRAPEVEGPQEEPAAVTKAKTAPRPENRVRKLAGKPFPEVAWPEPGSASVDLTSAQARSGRAENAGKRAGRLPVWVSPAATEEGDASGRAGDVTPDRVRIRVLSRPMAERAGLDGMLVRLARTDGGTSAAPVRMRLDYSSFAHAFGADYGSRLRLLRLPECALTTPDKAGCGPQPVADQRNDASSQVLTAQVEVAGSEGRTGPGSRTSLSSARSADSSGGSVYAVAADESGPQGDYSATKLSPSATWKVSPHSGAFSWSYPMRTPPVPGGLTPNLRVSYSSNGTDGRTAVTNNQPSWVGEGFQMWGGYIERSYKPCADDGQGDQSGDLCWGGKNAYMVLNGQASKLVKDGDTGEWHLKNDDGSRVEHLTGGSVANGDNNNERWRVTTADGTQYYFGRNRLPGWSAGNKETESSWTVPVFGDDAGEPCHAATFSGSWCKQAWKWNLDYVKDPHGNVISYFYNKEWNRYAREGDTTRDGTPYVRGGYLTYIDYGERAGDVYGKAPARVRFTVAERCLPDPQAGIECKPGELDDSTAEHWPDVPWDMYCAAGTQCELGQSAPSFWTRKRVTEVTTKVLQGGGSYSDVDSWKLEHLLPDSGDNSRALWLASIDHTGHAGSGTKSLPKVTFDGIQKPNRVDAQGDDIPPLIRLRVSQITNETGGTIDINYAGTQCTPATLPAPGSNTKRCFPQYWTPEGEPDPIRDWFHKYVVSKVIQTDLTGGSPDQMTDYTYTGGAAWAYDDTEGLATTDRRTWSQWRGYRHVRVESGTDQAPESRVDYTFLRGMDGDRKPGGGTRSVSVTDSTGVDHTDHESAVGFQMEKIVRNGPSGEVVSKTITTPWKHKTASRTRSWGTSKAFLTGTRVQRELTALESGGWRTAKKVFSHEKTAGLVTQVNDLGDTSTAADNLCTRAHYAKNTQAWLINYVKREETVSVNCATTPDRSSQVVSDERTFYDGQGFGVAPTTGDVTKGQEIEAHDGQSATYVTTGESTYDKFGRELTSTDAESNTTTTAYTDTGGLQTEKTVTNPLGHTTTTEYAVAWGKPVAEVDVNDRRTDLAYDPLGRLRKVWLPDRPKTSVSPNMKFRYVVQAGAPVAVATEEINTSGGYDTSWEIFDGFLRPRQTQAPGPEGGRLVTDTFHNARGKVAKENEAYYVTGAPSSTLLEVVNGDVNGQVLHGYDGAGREVTTIREVAGQEKWRTTTSYGGDRTHVDPPAGDTPTTVITDARGNRDELRQHHGSGPSGTYDATTYEHDAAGRLTQVTGPAENTWNYEYDLRGRKVRIDDPDSGVTTKTYDDLGQVTSEMDARGKTVAYSYDTLGRKTATFEGSTSGTKLAEWEYDTEHTGQLYRASRIDGGSTYSTYFVSRDRLYRPTRTVYHVPSSEGALGGYYTFTAEYNSDGTLQSKGMPAAGGLAAEGVVYSYDEVRRPVAVSGTSDYVTGTEYSYTGQPLQYELSTGGVRTWLTYQYEHGTQRLLRSKVDREGEATSDRDAAYTYDAAGNVTRIADSGGGVSDVQCFDYDHLRRLTEAWTPQGGGCGTAPEDAVLGGPAPYWNSYAYDASGNRTGEVRHGVGGAGDTTRSYVYPGHGGSGPHAVSRVDETGPAGSKTLNFGYDAAGNTTSRDLPGGGTQTLSWDAEGNLASTSQGGESTSFVYSAEGERLVRRGPAETVLYLPGMELRLDEASGQVSGKRYYSVNGQSVAVRVAGEGVSFLAPDHHGTAAVAVRADTGEAAIRRQTPFGRPRGSGPAWWPDDKGFVGGTRDPSGLTHLGAREYDPDTGRFVSVDPVLDTSDPQQMHGYAYANSSPVSMSDPDGLKLQCGYGPGCGYGGGPPRDGGGGSGGGGGPGIGLGDFYGDSHDIPTQWWGGGGSGGGSGGGGQAARAGGGGGSGSGGGGSGPSGVVRHDNGPNAYEQSQARAEAEREQSWLQGLANRVRDKASAVWGHMRENPTAWISGAALAACVVVSAGTCALLGAGAAIANYGFRGFEHGFGSRKAITSGVVELATAGVAGYAGKGLNSGWKLVDRAGWFSRPITRQWPRSGGGSVGRWRHARRNPVNVARSARNMGVNAGVSAGSHLVDRGAKRVLLGG